jgi:hypothetical protein
MSVYSKEYTFPILSKWQEEVFPGCLYKRDIFCTTRRLGGTRDVVVYFSAGVLETEESRTMSFEVTDSTSTMQDGQGQIYSCGGPGAIKMWRPLSVTTNLDYIAITYKYIIWRPCRPPPP